MSSLNSYKELGDRITNLPHDLIALLRHPEALQRITLLPSVGPDVQQGDDVPFVIIDDHTIETTRWIGTFRYHGQTYTVVPRIGLPLLRRIFHAAYTLVQLKAPAAVDMTDLFSELLPLVWFGAYNESVRRHGFPKEYVRRSDPHAAALRGRLDMAAQLRENVVLKHRIACEYNDLIYDNLINRYSLQVILRLKHRKMWPFTQIHSRVASRLMYDRDWLLTRGAREDIPRKELSLKKFVKNRNNYFYYPTLQLAEAILTNGVSL